MSHEIPGVFDSNVFDPNVFHIGTSASHLANTQVLHKPVNCVMAEEAAIEERVSTYDVRAPRPKFSAKIKRSGVRYLGGMDD